MQLIETETLDIEKNMSTVEDVQHNKPNSIDIEELDKKDLKCNGNKDITQIKTNTINENSAEVISEIEESIDNIPKPIENNEAHLSNVDVSVENSEQNSLETDTVQTENDSQDLTTENQVNGVITVPKENLDECNETEEDDLEDDIISISEEPMNVSSEQKTNEDNVTAQKEKTTNGNDTNALVEAENDIQLENNRLKDEDNDVIEVLEESEELNDTKKCPDASITVPEIVQENKDEIEIVEESDKPAIESEKQISESLSNQSNGVDSGDKSNGVEISDKNVALSTEIETINVEEKEETNIISAIDSNDKEVLLEPSAEEEMRCESEEKNDPLPISIANKSESNAPAAVDNVENGIIEIDEDISSTDADEIKEDPLTENKNDSEDSNETKEITVEDRKTDSPSPANLTSETLDSSENLEVPIEIIDSLKQSAPPKETSETKVVDPLIVQKTGADMDIDETVEEAKEKESTTNEVDSPIELKDDMDVEEIVEEPVSKTTNTTNVKDVVPAVVPENKVIDKPIICKLSNNLEILSDDDDEEESPVDELPKAESPKVESPKAELAKEISTNEKQCINIEDDDDIMLIDEEPKKDPIDLEDYKEEEINQPKSEIITNSETGEKTVKESHEDNETKKELTLPPSEADDTKKDIDINEKSLETKIVETPPLVPDNFLKTAKKGFAEMTREELEEFCILKIVESVIDRTSLSEIKNKLKIMTQGLEEFRKKAMMLTKQNRDLQLVLKSVQEEQKKASDTAITPLKITRSVGMQVFMEKAPVLRRKGQQQNTVNKNTNSPQNRNVNPAATRLPKATSVNIPVPRLVPAYNPAKNNIIPQGQQINTPSKNINPPNGVVKTPPPVSKAEKRTFNKMSSVTVDLTDDEPPTKLPVVAKTSPVPPVRLVPSQNLMAPQRQAFGTAVNSPRKVYIPISGPQNQTLRPGQTIMLKTVPATGMRTRCPAPQVTRVDNTAKPNKAPVRHPAPLPLAMKQYQPPNWKPLPPAPDLKLSKVENGIVISWKIENIPEDSYEEIASYQLYAYQETASAPSTTLWKKIGDVKALPLPMACTLTQFMAGFKYYFAVRAVDIRSRLGPFSLPGSILLLSKNNM